MKDETRVILLALECLLKTVASSECHELWKLPKEKLEKHREARENYINSTVKCIKEVLQDEEKNHG